MADERVIYTSPGNGRHESNAIWRDCQKDLIRDSYGKGTFFETDFKGLPTGIWTATQATAGTFALDATDEKGVALADCNSTTATQGINVQAAGVAFKMSASTKLWYEARVKIADTATGPELFVGLSDVETAIIASSAVASDNYLGFYSITDNNVISFASEDGGTQTNKASVATLVDDTWVKLGFKVDGLSKVTAYVNGAALEDYEITTNIVDALVVPSFVCQSGGTTDPILHIDWVKCYQLG